MALGWKEAEAAGVQLSSWWPIARRDDRFPVLVEGFHGAFVPQIAEHAVLRHTDPGDVVLDPCMGSGTSLQVACFHGRRALGIDLNPTLVEEVPKALGRFLGQEPEALVLQGDATSERTWTYVRMALELQCWPVPQLAILHPPYWRCLRFSEDPSDLSCRVDLQTFRAGIRHMADQAVGLLQPGGFLVLVMGDVYEKGRLLPLSAHTITDLLDLEKIRLKSTYVKPVFGNELGNGGRSRNLWKARAMRGGFNLLGHETISVWQKEPEHRLFDNLHRGPL